MNFLKRYLGIFWMIVGPVTIFLLLKSAIQNINAAGTADINQPLPWIIIISIFTPIALGLTIFGWYCWRGEFDHTTEKSEI